MMHCFSNHYKLVTCEIKTVVLNTIYPMNSKKWVATFSWIFHFSLIDFSWKIYENLFPKWGPPWGYMKLKIVKSLLLGDVLPPSDLHSLE